MTFRKYLLKEHLRQGSGFGRGLRCLPDEAVAAWADWLPGVADWMELTRHRRGVAFLVGSSSS
jgi:hypothetical protein